MKRKIKVAKMEKEFINLKKLNEYYDSMYEVKTAVPVIENPYIITHIINRAELDKLLSDLAGCAEFLISIKIIKR